MNTKLIIRILICSVSVLLLIASGLAIGFLANPEEKRPDTTKIVIPQTGEGTNSEASVKFEAPKIHPGETVSHTVALTGEVEGEAKITLGFKEDKEKTNELAKYLYASVTVDGEKYCDMLLFDLFSAKLDSIVRNLNRKDPIIIEISYRMPIEIGNEAENAEAFFSLLITSSNEK